MGFKILLCSKDHSPLTGKVENHQNWENRDRQIPTVALHCKESNRSHVINPACYKQTRRGQLTCNKMTVGVRAKKAEAEGLALGAALFSLMKVRPACILFHTHKVCIQVCINYKLCLCVSAHVTAV